MALPRPTRSWTLTPAAVVVPAQGSITATNVRVIRLLVAYLVSAGIMTEDYSSDSVTAGTKGDGVDRWVADANIVGAAPGVAHSWKVTTSVHGGQVCWDRDAAGDRFGSIWYSAAVGFTGGTILNRPTAADEIEITSSVSWLNGASNGNHTVHVWRCNTAGQEGIRLAVLSSAESQGPVAAMQIERPTIGVDSLMASPPFIARWNCGGNGGTAGDRTGWGWSSWVSGVSRAQSLTGLGPQTVVDPDGNWVLETIGITNVTIGTIGWVDDFYTVTENVANGTTFSDLDGARGWLVLDSIVWPWDHVTVVGSNVATVRLNIRYTAPTAPSPPTITILSPTPGVPAGDPGGFPASYAAAKDVPLRLRVVDAAPGLRLLIVTLRMTVPAPFANPFPCTMTVYDDAAGGLQLPFDPAHGSVVTPIANGFDLDLVLPEGWPRGAQLNAWVHAVDQAGALS